ncbi:hypothetical protein ABBQ32_000405 [Trebouxia sp. C0010 RCD-2024]
MIRWSAKALTFCRSPACRGTSLRLAETLPVACQAVFPSLLQRLLPTGFHKPLTTKSACFLFPTRGPYELDLNYRSPTEKVWPASPRQQKVASRVTRALELTLSQPSFLETLVKEYGLCVEEVRMSPDMLTAYVLWSAHPDCEGAAQHELQSRVSKIRASVGKALKARHVPKLEFRLNQPSESQSAVQMVLDRLKERDT